MKPLSLVATVAFAIACDGSAAQDLSGRWRYNDNGETAELLLEHDKSSGKVSGTFTAFGKQASISGRADASALVIDKVGDVPASPENGTQASGRGAFVGNRVRLALCADGTTAFDVSDLASTGGAAGVNMGNATSRRGNWGIVLLAGMPVVRAQWSGTGSSYSLTRYFRVQPLADGSGARVDGTDLPIAGSC